MVFLSFNHRDTTSICRGWVERVLGSSFISRKERGREIYVPHQSVGEEYKICIASFPKPDVPSSSTMVAATHMHQKGGYEMERDTCIHTSRRERAHRDRRHKPCEDFLRVCGSLPDWHTGALQNKGHPLPYPRP